jgi:valyl-tRNA synthetase
MNEELTPTDTDTTTPYEPQEIEGQWYDYWMEHGMFNADPDPEKEAHTIVIPPPNVTGRLHMGHALQGTIQDAITRIRRMQGYEALWLPGTDHAGIATQNRVERTLEEESGQDRHELGREPFVDRVWEWKEQYGAIIIDQLKKLGASCDWRRERFTMDDGFTRAVQEVFVRLYEEGLIYRGDYLVNWCPKDRTALSDEEVDNVETEGHLWYIKYPFVDGPVNGRDHVVVATTRPETMLGDTGIAVNPENERYADVIGRKVRLPLIGRELPIVAADDVSSDFGAGALKVTPGHDKTDFEIGKRHDLEVINIFNPDATVNENGGPYEGLDRFEARDRIVDDLKAEGLLVTVEPHMHKVPVSSRSDEIIEPLISRQWFVSMEPLAEQAMQSVRTGDVEFHPRRWENEFFRWMENIRDWCISRQLWWGHRIPVWYHTDENGDIDESRDYVVSIDQPEPGMVQDEDVLDTWFSSWLWPFATLGWPEETEDLEYFYPTDVLVSGYDILFFWIARMMMAGEHFTGRPPFSDVFITGMIKDKHGRWMSKSLGNGIDPLEMIDRYGTDAVRYSLTVLCAQGQDIKLDPSRFEMGRNFANKIWNAFNVFDQFRETGADYRRERSFEELSFAEQWMLTRLNAALDKIDEDIDRYRLNEALGKIYDLFWKDYCDWYLELIKPPYGEAMEEDTIALAVEIYEKMTKLLHPFMPYITEELWWKLRPREEGEACIVAEWPRKNPEAIDPRVADAFGTLQEMVSGIRNIRSEMNIPHSAEITALVNVSDAESYLARQLREHSEYFQKLANVAELTVDSGIRKPEASAAVVVGGSDVYVPLQGVIDLEVERERLKDEISEKEEFLGSVERQLSNEQFLTKAPEEVVEKERKKKKDAKTELKKLRENLENLRVTSSEGS